MDRAFWKVVSNTTSSSSNRVNKLAAAVVLHEFCGHAFISGGTRTVQSTGSRLSQNTYSASTHVCWPNGRNWKHAGPASPQEEISASPRNHAWAPRATAISPGVRKPSPNPALTSIGHASQPASLRYPWGGGAETLAFLRNGEAGCTVHALPSEKNGTKPPRCPERDFRH